MRRDAVPLASRIVSRREGGKVHFLDVKDWSGQPTLREIKGEREGDVEEVPDLSSRIQVMVGQKPPKADEEFSVIQFSSEPLSLELRVQFPGVKLTPDAVCGECEVELSVDEERDGEQKLGFVLQEASNAVKIRGKKKP